MHMMVFILPLLILLCVAESCERGMKSNTVQFVGFDTGHGKKTTLAGFKECGLLAESTAWSLHGSGMVAV